MFQDFDRDRGRGRDRDRDRGRDRDRDRDRDRNRDRDRDRDRDFRRDPLDFLRFLTPSVPFFPQRPQFGPPVGPPPTFIPQEPVGTFAVDPRAIGRCLSRFTFIWPYRGNPFWFFPTFAGPNSVAGFRWAGFNWVYFGLDLREIRSFLCV